jgi:SAM-dependent methyltransferase
MDENNSCPLCLTEGSAAYYEDWQRPYLQCSTCQLVFVPPAYYLSAADEKAQYDLHQNSPDDPDYRRFLSRLFNPIQARLTPRSHGLDFGSGPGPTLSQMFTEAGHEMTLYDVFYAKDESVWEKQYDFITASEVVEHLHLPEKELARLWNCLKPGGTLGLMTKLVLNRQAFSQWHYKNDRTHICFFSSQTFTWLGSQWGRPPTFVGQDVIVFAKIGLSRL